MKKIITLILLIYSLSLCAESLNITPKNSEKYGITIFKNRLPNRKNDLFLITFIFPKEVDNVKFFKTKAGFFNKKLGKSDIQLNLATRPTKFKKKLYATIFLTKEKANDCSIAIHYQKEGDFFEADFLIYNLKLKDFLPILLSTKEEEKNSEQKDQPDSKTSSQ